MLNDPRPRPTSRRIRHSVPTLVLAVCLAATGAVHAQLFDGGFETGDISTWSSSVPPAPTTFRISDLDLRDPHVVADLPLAGCSDFTDQPQLGGLVPAFNASVEQLLISDGDGDSQLDLSPLLLFRPLNTTSGARVDFRVGNCSFPVVGTSCFPDALIPATAVSYQAQNAGTCLGPLPGTTSGYQPSVAETLAPCFVTEAQDLVFSLGGIGLPLQEAQIAGSFQGDPPTFIDSGLIRGFLSETVAEATLLPADLPQVGGQPLSSLLPGGTGSCVPAPGDLDQLDGVSGWWFYLAFEADPVPYGGI